MTDGPYDVPGNPGALRAAASSWAKAASSMGSAAGQVRSSGLSSGDFSGQAAAAHADQIEALAAAHQIARDALFSASGALEIYATILEAAQADAAKANAAATQAASLQKQLQHPPPGDPAVTGRFGPVAGSDPAYDLNIQLTAAQTTMKLGPSAQTAAINAAHRAAIAFNNVAALAGNPADHHLTNPWERYLGQGSLVGVAETLINGENQASLAGLNRPVENNDQHIFSDFENSPGIKTSPAALRMIKSEVAAQNGALKLVSGLKAELAANRIIIPAGIANLDPLQQANALALLWAGYKQEESPSPGFIKFMKVTSLALGGVALVTAWIPIADLATSGAAVGSEAATETLIAGVSVSRAAELTSLAAGGASGGIDITVQASTGDWDPIALVFDAAAIVPGLAAVSRGTAESAIDAQIDELKADPTSTPKQLKALQTVKQNIVTGHLAAGAIGANTAILPVIYGAGTLLVPGPGDPASTNVLTPHLLPTPQVNPATARFGPGPWSTKSG